MRRMGRPYRRTVRPILVETKMGRTKNKTTKTKKNLNKNKVRCQCTYKKRNGVVACSFCNYSCKTYEFAYRWDTRPPDEIFKEGFKTRGKKEFTLVKYLKGGLIGPAYISSIANDPHQDNRYRLLSKLFGSDMPPFIYSYKIRADDNFYNVNESICAFKKAVDEGCIAVHHSCKLCVAQRLEEYNFQNEILSKGNISSESILYRMLQI